MKTLSLFALIIALGLALVAANVLAAEPMVQPWGKAFSFNQIMGTPVKNHQGEELGKIHDIVIDSQGHIPFAVLSYGGFLGLAGKLVAVPFSALEFDPMGKYLILDTTKEKFDSAPAFKVSDLSNEKWAGDDYRFFGQQPYWMEGGALREETSPAKEKPTKKQTEEEYPYNTLSPF
jgi:sporulation protein YlmC with PRC-barrel domain